MGKILYVGNLTDSATQTNLEEWFAQYGTVHSAHLISDRETGRSRGVRLRRDGHGCPGSVSDPGTPRPRA